MSTTLTSSRAGISPLHPLVTGAFGALVFGAAMFAGEAFDLNADPSDVGTSTGEWLVTGAIAAVGLAIGLALGLRAWAGDTTRLSRTALGMAVAGAVLFVVFWSGWPSVFSAVAVGLALEHRRRIGSFATSTAIAAGLGVLAFTAVAYICVTG